MKHIDLEYQGLSQREAAERRQKGQVNIDDLRSSRSLLDIFRANIFTRFNALLGVLFIIVFGVGARLDAVFAIIVILNSGIGISQEWRAKRTLDRLAILNTPVAHVLRDGELIDIPVQEVVLDDLLRVKAGDQIPTDGIILRSNELEIDESLLTGESESIFKHPNDSALSGSIVVAGDGYLRVTAVGSKSYAHKLSAEVKLFTPARSELMDGINMLLRYISWIIAIVAPFLVWRQIVNNDTWQEALVRSTAAITGMIPEGLVLLTSLAFALAAVSLARRRVLVQQLAAVEGLARVDTICLDKTGTLTEGSIELDDLHLFDEKRKTKAERVLATFSAEPSSPTLLALQNAFQTRQHLQVLSTVPFSSARKWSALTLKGGESWVMGAPEIVDPTASSDLRKQAQAYAEQGKRVIALMRTEETPTATGLPLSLKPVGLVVLTERIREDAKETLAFFAKQGVMLKLLSGDNPETVAAIARRVGIEVDQPIDARTLPHEPKALQAAVEQGHVFGRVTPEQKRAMVKALQLNGHTVAMTGDGVNDALALKHADIGIAMGNGTAATKAIAEVVLLDSKFSHLPEILAEGRRVIGNIERIANLFVIKNVYSLVLALGVTFMGLPFPFLPRHLTVISALTIGIPAFFIALAPNSQRSQPGFLRRVLRFAIPTGAFIGLLAFIAYLPVSEDELSYVSMVTSSIVMIIGIWVLFRLATPLNVWKVMLILLMPLIFIGVTSSRSGRNLLDVAISRQYLVYMIAMGMLGVLMVELIWRLNRRFGLQKLGIRRK